jgi:hypothetical protein
MGEKTIRIGCASGFWGDSYMAAPQLVKSGRLDYLVFDYLAEITMSIMARARARSAEAGYATDFVTVTLRGLLRDIAAQGIKVVSNAGGVNPLACGRAIEALIAEAGLDLKVAVVMGDDLLDRAEDFRARGLREMFSGDVMPERLMSMNAYLGARPIAEALAAGADIVVTGRVVDSAVTLGPCLHEFGWSDADYDRLACGSLAGHILECGAQATGGLFTDWRQSENWANIGYPIAEVSADGSFVTTKPEGTGGLVTPATVAEQMLYEIGDPQAYLLPDVACDFSQVRMESCGPDRVRVSGAKGLPPTDSYKVSATFQDGHRVGLYHTLIGPDAAAKARKTAEAILERCRAMFRDQNLPDFSDTSVEVLGAEDSYGANARPLATREVVLKIAARHPETRALETLVREATSAVTSMAPGTTGMGGNRPKVSPVVRLFSCLVPKAEVQARVIMNGDVRSVAVPAQGGFDPAAIERVPPGPERRPEGASHIVPLLALAHGRSGDKGNDANVGIIARKPDYLPYIRAALSEAAVADYFAQLWDGSYSRPAEHPVTRYEVPGIDGLNFLLKSALRGGGIASLRNDPQGKALAQMLLDFPVPVPEGLALH